MTNLYPWAMLATNYDDVYVNYPVYIQAKLNGVRAKWDVQLRLLVSRQGKIIPESVLPELYDNLKKNYKSLHSLDGELYSHDLPFQELCGAVNGKRKVPHRFSWSVQFFAFDVISKEPSPRSIDWSNKILIYKCDNKDNFEYAKSLYIDSKQDSKYDGVILRVPGAPYIVGRTEALIKWKPWKYAKVEIKNAIEGTGKFKNMLGAYEVRWNCKVFKVGGGNITEQERKEVWLFRFHLPKLLDIRYRELSKDGIPLQPQIAKL